MIALARRGAGWIVRAEISALTIIYGVFVITDQVPWFAWAWLALTWGARRWLTGKFTRATAFDLPLGVLLVCLPLSFSVTIAPATSLPKVFGVLLAVAFFYATVNAIQTPRDLAWATFWLVIVCAGIALAGLIGTDWAQSKIVSASFIYDRLPRVVQGIPRSIAGGFARNGVGGALALIVPLLVALAIQNARSPQSAIRNSVYNPILFGATLLALATLALTQSRGGILGAAVGVLGVAIWRERKFVWLIAASVAALIGLIALGYGNALLDFVLRMDAQSGTLASRLEVWQRGWLMVRDFPFTGIGIGTYNAMAHLMYPFFIAAPEEVVAHAHNQLLQVAVDLGIPGLVAYCALLAAFALSVTRAYRAPAAAATHALIVGVSAGMIAHHVFGLTDAFMLGTKPGIVMWIFFAFGAALDAQRTARDA